jgi:putative hydrolase of the HAD superfamily
MDPKQAIRRIKKLSRPLAPIPTGRSPLIRRLPAIHAVLFDVYGTLFVSASGDISAGVTEAHTQALLQSCRALGTALTGEGAQRGADLLVDTIRQTHRELQAKGIEKPEVEIRQIFTLVLQRLCSEGHLLEQPDGELAARLALEYECRINPTWPMPGLQKTLLALRDKSMPMGIVSNAQFYTPLLFEAHLGSSLETLGFDPTLCAWSYRTGRAKPSTALFEGVAEKLNEMGIEAGRVLYVGNDRLNDVLPARQAGFKTALFAGDKRSFRPRPTDPRLKEVREDLLITALSQLSEIL